MSASSLGVMTLVETFIFRTSVFYWSFFLPEMVVVLSLIFCGVWHKENHRTGETLLLYHSVLRAWLYDQ